MIRTALTSTRLRLRPLSQSLFFHTGGSAGHYGNDGDDVGNMLQSACLLYGREIANEEGEWAPGEAMQSGPSNVPVEQSRAGKSPSLQWRTAIALVGDHVYAGTWSDARALEALMLMRGSLRSVPSRRTWPHRVLWRDALEIAGAHIQRFNPNNTADRSVAVLIRLAACHVEAMSCVAPNNGLSEESIKRLLRVVKESLMFVRGELSNEAAAMTTTAMTSTLCTISLLISTTAINISRHGVCLPTSFPTIEAVVMSVVSCVSCSDPAIVAIVERAAREEPNVVSDTLLAVEWLINVMELQLNHASPPEMRKFAALLRRYAPHDHVWWDRSAVTSTLLLPSDYAPFEKTSDELQAALDEAMGLWRNVYAVDATRRGDVHSLLLPAVLIPFLNNTVLMHLVRLHEQYSSFGPHGTALQRKVRAATEEVLRACGSCVADRVVTALVDAEDRCGSGVASAQALVDLLSQFTRLPAAIVASRQGAPSLVDTILARAQQSRAQRIRRELQEATGEVEFTTTTDSEQPHVEGSPYPPLHSLLATSCSGSLSMSSTTAVTTGSDGLSTQPTWASAVALVQEAMSATAENAPEWRVSLPAAIELCAAAGKHNEALHLFDEYLIGVAPPLECVGATSPSALLQEPLECVRALQGAARSLDATGRWYRAMDVLSGLSAMEGSATADQRLTDGVAKTFSLLSHCVRGRWEESLTLASLVVSSGSKSLANAVAPNAIRSLAAPETSVPNGKGGSLLWLEAIGALMKASDGNAVASIRNACVCLLAAKDPLTAAALIAKSQHRGDATAASMPFATVDDAMRQFAANGAWDAALAVCLSHEAATFTVSPHWDSVAVALQNHRGARTDPEALNAETISRVVASVPNGAVWQRSVLRSLYRTAENHAAFREVAAALRIKSAAEKQPDARRRIDEFASMAEWAANGGGGRRSDAPRMTLTDPMLVHIHSSSPLATDGTPVAFEWSHAELNVLRRKYNGNVKQYIERELNIPSECVRARDLRALSASGAASLKAGDRLVIFPKYRPSEHSMKHVNKFFLRSLIVASRRDFTVLTKPPGIRVEELIATLNDACLFRDKMTPAFQLQATCEGLLVVAPCTAPRIRIASCHMFLLLGLRRISTDGVVHAWETAFFRKYHMTVMRVIPAGQKIESSEVVVVECHCASDEVNVAGSLYQLTMDLAVEGWGYDGDSGNTFLEDELDRQSIVSKAKRSKQSAEQDVSEGRRTLYLLREVHVRTLPSSRGDSGCDDNESRFVAEMDIPQWWFDDGFLPMELSAKSCDP